MTPIEQVREALSTILKKRIPAHAREDYRRGYMDALTEAHEDASAALAILKDMKAQEPVAWMAVIRYPDGDDSLVYGSTREGAVQIGHERTRVTGTVVRVAPLYAHPSPSAPVDLSEEDIERMANQVADDTYTGRAGVILPQGLEQAWCEASNAATDAIRYITKRYTLHPKP